MRDDLQIVPWNGRGIVGHRSHEYFVMGSAIRKLANHRHVLCFQEVHGHKAAVVASFSCWLPGWIIVASACLDAQDFEDPASGVL